MMLVSIQIGKPQNLGVLGANDPLDRPWRSAIIKRMIHAPVRVKRDGLEGDGQADRRHHGGFDKALLAYAASHYPAWREELGKDEVAFPPGAFGENLLVDGLNEDTVCIGDVYSIGGGVRVEVSQPRQPCLNLTRLWRMDMMNRVKASGRTGWYLRVLGEGMIEAGMQITLLARPNPDWSIARATEIMLARRSRKAEALMLWALPQLSISWKESLNES